MGADPANKCGRIYIGRPIGEAGKPCVLAAGHGGVYCRNAEGASWPKGAGEAVLVNPACRSACECHQNGGPCGELDCDCPSYRIQQWGREIEANFAHRAALMAQRDAETHRPCEGPPLPDQRVTRPDERPHNDEDDEEELCRSCDAPYRSRTHVECCMGPGDYKGDDYQLR